VYRQGAHDAQRLAGAHGFARDQPFALGKPRQANGSKVRELRPAIANQLPQFALNGGVRLLHSNDRGGFGCGGQFFDHAWPGWDIATRRAGRALDFFSASAISRSHSTSNGPAFTRCGVRLVMRWASGLRSTKAAITTASGQARDWVRFAMSWKPDIAGQRTNRAQPPNQKPETQKQTATPHQESLAASRRFSPG